MLYGDLSCSSKKTKQIGVWIEQCAGLYEDEHNCCKRDMDTEFVDVKEAKLNDVLKQ